MHVEIRVSELRRKLKSLYIVSLLSLALGYLTTLFINVLVENEKS